MTYSAENPSGHMPQQTIGARYFGAPSALVVPVGGVCPLDKARSAWWSLPRHNNIPANSILVRPCRRSFRDQSDPSRASYAEFTLGHSLWLHLVPLAFMSLRGPRLDPTTRFSYICIDDRLPPCEKPMSEMAYTSTYYLYFIPTFYVLIPITFSYFIHQLSYTLSSIFAHIHLHSHTHTFLN